MFDLATLVDEKVHDELVGEVELRLKSDRLVAVVNSTATQRLWGILSNLSLAT